MKNEVENNKNFDFIFFANCSTDWEFWYSIKDEFLYVTPSSKEISGYSPKEFYDNPLIMKKIIHPNDWGRWQNHIEEINTKSTFTPSEYKIITKNGDLRWIELISSKIFDEKGLKIGIRSNFRDITERKKREKTLRGLLPICSNCKKIRNDEGYYVQLEEFFHKHSDIAFTHGLCPDCIKIFYGDHIFDEEEVENKVVKY